MINFTYLLSNDLDSLNKPRYSNWLKSVIVSEGRKTGDIQYIFCDDKHLLEINKTYLKHDTFTDIITFSTTDNDEVISGEIYIIIDRVNENYKAHSISFIEELNRVMVHGILHLIGYDDQSDTDIKLMRSKEDYYLHLLR